MRRQARVRNREQFVESSDSTVYLVSWTGQPLDRCCLQVTFLVRRWCCGVVVPRRIPCERLHRGSFPSRGLRATSSYYPSTSYSGVFSGRSRRTLMTASSSSPTGPFTSGLFVSACPSFVEQTPSRDTRNSIWNSTVVVQNVTPVRAHPVFRNSWPRQHIYMCDPREEIWVLVRLETGYTLFVL